MAEMEIELGYKFNLQVFVDDVVGGFSKLCERYQKDVDKFVAGETVKKLTPNVNLTNESFKVDETVLAILDFIADSIPEEKIDTSKVEVQFITPEEKWFTCSDESETCKPPQKKWFDIESIEYEVGGKKKVLERENMSKDYSGVEKTLGSYTTRNILFYMEQIWEKFIQPMKEGKELPEWSSFVSNYIRPVVWIEWNEKSKKKEKKKIIKKSEKTIEEMVLDNNATADIAKKNEAYKKRKESEKKNIEAKKKLEKAKKSQSLEAFYKEFLNSVDMASIVSSSVSCLESFAGNASRELLKNSLAEVGESIGYPDTTSQIISLIDTEGVVGVSEEDVGSRVERAIGEKVPIKNVPKIPTLTLDDSLPLDDPTGGMYERVEKSLKKMLKDFIISKIQTDVFSGDCSDIGKIVSGEAWDAFSESVSGVIGGVLDILDEFQDIFDNILKTYSELMDISECFTAEKFLGFVEEVSASVLPADYIGMLRGEWNIGAETQMMKAAEGYFTNCEAPSDSGLYFALFEEIGGLVGDGLINGLEDGLEGSFDLQYGDKIVCDSIYDNFADWLRRQGYEEDVVECLIEKDRESKDKDLSNLLDYIYNDEEPDYDSEVNSLLLEEPSYKIMLGELFSSLFSSVFSRFDDFLDNYVFNVSELDRGSSELLGDSMTLVKGNDVAVVNPDKFFIDGMGFNPKSNNSPVDTSDNNIGSYIPLPLVYEKYDYKTNIVGFAASRTQDLYTFRFSPDVSENYQIVYTEMENKDLVNRHKIEMTVNYDRKQKNSEANPVTDKMNEKIWEFEFGGACEQCDEVMEHITKNYSQLLSASTVSPQEEVDEYTQEDSDLWTNINEPDVQPSTARGMMNGNSNTFKRELFSAMLSRNYELDRQEYFKNYFKNGLYNKLVSRSFKEIVGEMREEVNPFKQPWVVGKTDSGENVYAKGIEIFPELFKKAAGMDCLNSGCSLFSEDVMRDYVVGVFLGWQKVAGSASVDYLKDIASVVLTVRLYILQFFVSNPYYVHMFYDGEKYGLIEEYLCNRILDGNDLDSSILIAHEALIASGVIENEGYDIANSMAEGTQELEGESYVKSLLLEIVGNDLQKFLPVFSSFIGFDSRRKRDSFVKDEIRVRNYAGYSNNIAELNHVILENHKISYSNKLYRDVFFLSPREDLFYELWYEDENGNRDVIKLVDYSDHWHPSKDTFVNYSSGNKKMISEIASSCSRIGMNLSYGVFGNNLYTVLGENLTPLSFNWSNKDIVFITPIMSVELSGEELGNVVSEAFGRVFHGGGQGTYEKVIHDGVYNALRRKMFDSVEFNVLFEYSLPFKTVFEISNILLHETINYSTNFGKFAAEFINSPAAIQSVVSGGENSEEIEKNVNNPDFNIEDTFGMLKSFFAKTPVQSMAAEMAKTAAKMIFKGVTEQTDPNIKAARYIVDSAKMVGRDIPIQVASLAMLLPVNLVPMFGWGPPITPQGIAYLVLETSIEKQRKSREMISQIEEDNDLFNLESDGTQNFFGPFSFESVCEYCSRKKDELVFEEPEEEEEEKCDI